MAIAQPPSLDGLTDVEDSVQRSRYQRAPEASNADHALNAADEINNSAFATNNSLSGWPIQKSKLPVAVGLQVMHSIADNA